MSENLMNSDHKATTDKYREGYEAIEWEGRDKQEFTISKTGKVYGAFLKASILQKFHSHGLRVNEKMILRLE